MGRSRALVALFVIGCGGGGGGGGGGGAPHGDPAAELYSNGFYRAPGGHVVAALPPSIVENGKIENDSFAGHPTLLATTSNPLLLVAIAALDGDVDAAARDDFAKILSTAGLSIDGLPTHEANGDVPGGKVTGTTYGPSAPGMVVAMGTVRDGADAALIVVIGKDADVTSASSFVFQHVRVGSKVPRAVDRHPSRALSGTYESEAVARDAELQVDWLTFDPRGYAHAFEPSSPETFDFDALVAGHALGLFGCDAYDVKDGKLVILPGTDGAPVTRTLSGDGATLVIDGDTYHQVDGTIADGTKLDGTYEWYSGASTGGMETMNLSTRKDFHFGSDGTVSFEGGTSVIGTGYDATGVIDSTMSAYADSGTWKGTYKIEHDRLLVETDQKVKLTFPIFAAYDTGRRAEKVVSIAGRLYIKQ